MGSGSQSAAVRRLIEASLADRIPAALSPAPVQEQPRLLSTGCREMDELLGGGLPLGGISEFTGAECSGRTSLALSLLAVASREAACAYVDPAGSFDPASAAAAGVQLENLLWVSMERLESSASVAPKRSVAPPEQAPQQQKGFGWMHPRAESNGIGPALESMLAEKTAARMKKSVGTPGFPNRPLIPACDPDSGLSLARASDEQVAYDQFFARRADLADPRRRLDYQAAAEARTRGYKACSTPARLPASENPWRRLDRAIRAVDQILQSGGFQVIVFDLASVSPEQALRIPAATWFRFRRAAQLGDAILLLVTEEPCARSSASCVLECSLGNDPVQQAGALITGWTRVAQVARQRTAPSYARKAPQRAATWSVVPPWMRAAGE